MPQRLISLIFIGLFFVSAAPSWAEDSTEPTRIARSMTAIDATTLQSEGIKISLWGILPAGEAGGSLRVKALEFTDGLIAGGTINCKIAGGVAPSLWARCTNAASADLGLELLNNGYATVNRAEVAGTPFAEPYKTAESAARAQKKGIWREVASDGDTSSWMMIGAVIAGPLLGVLVTVLMMQHWIKRMNALHREEAEQARRRELSLLARERRVLAAALEGELAENRDRILAFLLIYRDMLASLQNTNETPKYQRAGDIVQKHATMSKKVFEANAGRLSLLDVKLAGRLSKLYSSLPDDRDYITLEPDTPLKEATSAVEEAVKEAESSLAALEESIKAVGAALQEKPEEQESDG